MRKFDPIDTVEKSIEHAGQDANELPHLLGGEEAARAVMAREQPLTESMIENVVREWGIPRTMLTR